MNALKFVSIVLYVTVFPENLVISKMPIDL